MRTRSGLKVFTLLALMMLIAPPVAQAQDLLWVKQWDGGGGLMAVDRSHNVYRVGGFSGTMDFDPGIGTFELTASGDIDVFVSKIDREGGFLWAGRLGGTGYIFANSAALDDDGNVYIFGFFYPGTYDFDPGPGTFELTTISADAYVCKLDSSGNFVWAIAFGPDSSALSGTVDGDHVYPVGLFGGTVDFDPGPGTFELTSDEGIGFVSKLDSAGSFVWAVQLGDVPRGVFVDPNSSIYTVGFFFGTDDFDPGPGTFFLTSFGAEDGFVSKLDSAGHFVWAGQFGGPNLVRTWGVVVDSNGNVYTVGRFSDTVDFDPGPGTFFLTSIGEENSFVSKLDSAGHFVWAKQLGGTVMAARGAVALDSSDNVYTVGWFSDTVDFDPGPGTFFLTSFGGNDAFVSKLDSAGHFVWAKQLGGASGDSAGLAAVDSSDNLYIVGGFRDTVDFNPAPGRSSSPQSTKATFSSGSLAMLTSGWRTRIRH
jgi:hypothetical protein